MARAGRRRRVLNEEVRAAGSISTTIPQPDEPSPNDTPRYGEQANVEHHPQVTDFVPRRFGMVVLVVLSGLVIAGMAESLDRYADQLGTLFPMVSQLEVSHLLSPGLSRGLIAWSSAVVLLVAGMYARLIFMLRRHRVDDYRGRYRIWRTVSWLAVLLSLNSVLALHGPVARMIGGATGWQLLSGQSGWWLALAVLVCGPVLVRLTLDIAESRAAMAVMLLAIVCYATAGVAIAINWSPEWLGSWSGLLSHTLPFLGHVLMLAAIMLNARYVVLDVQGLLRHPQPRRTAQNKQRAYADLPLAKTMDKSADKPTREPIELPFKAPARKTTPKSSSPAVLAVTHETTAAADSQWVNGTEKRQESPQRQKRRLSKSERKRLRKQKTRHAA